MVPVLPSAWVASRAVMVAWVLSSFVMVPVRRPGCPARRWCRCVGEGDGEGLVGLDLGVAADGDADGVPGLARGEVTVLGQGGVVAAAAVAEPSAEFTTTVVSKSLGWERLDREGEVLGAAVAFGLGALGR